MRNRWREAVLLALSSGMALAYFLRRVSRLSPAEAALEMERGAALLDVRTSGEFARRHVRGAANIPLHDLPARMGEIETGRPLLVMCAHGPRSVTAAAMLRTAGIDAHPVKGGPEAWPPALQVEK